MPKYPEPTIELRRLGRRVIEANFEGGDQDQALCATYREGGMTTTALAREADLSVMHVGRLIRPWAAFTAPRTPLRCTACLRAQRTCPLSTHHTFL